MNARLWKAAKENSVATCREVLNHHMRGNVCAEVNSKSEYDWTALHIAANEGSADVCKVLIEYSLEVDLSAVSNLEQTPLHLAAEKGFLDIIQLLVNSGADINLQDKFGRTALHLVAAYGHVDAASLLLGKDPRTDIKDQNGRTAYQCSCNSAVAEVFEVYFIVRNMPFSKVRVQRRPQPTPPRQDQIDRLLLKAQTASTPIALQIFADRVQRPVYDIMSSARWKGEVDETEFPHAEYCDFQVVCLLGRGSFGEVYLVQKKDSGVEYAMKVLSKDRVIGQNLMRYAITERNVLTCITHPFIVGLHFAFQTPEKLVLIMSYCPGGDLSRVIRRERKCEIDRLSEERARLYMCEVLLALEELHSRSIIYRDLKPENVVLDEEGHAMLTDFGLSKEGISDRCQAQSFCGSIGYLAPEVIKQQGHNKTVDYYLLGVLLYEMLVGMPPFFDENPEKMFRNIVRAPVSVPSFVSGRAEDILQKLLEKDPNKRLGAGPSGVFEIKAHSFFDSIDWLRIYNREISPGPISRTRVRPGVMLTEEEVFGILDQHETKEPLKGWSFIQPGHSVQSSDVPLKGSIKN